MNDESLILKFESQVDNCARCGKFHESILYLKFTRPNKHYSHFGVCPETKEPILLKIEEDN